MPVQRVRKNLIVSTAAPEQLNSPFELTLRSGGVARMRGEHVA
ncbi:MAG: hypothetical protein ACLQVD_20295 [Capsulimonadaceae bacterium]